MKTKRSVGIFFVMAIMAIWVARASASPGQHTVTVTLNYDFSLDNACSAAVTTACINLKAGAHTFAATAQMADGTESSPNASTAIATVAPGTPASFSVVVQ